MVGTVLALTIAFAVVLSVVALTVASIAASQESGSNNQPMYMVRTSVAAQAVAAAAVTPLLFDTQIALSGGGDISYTSIGGLFQVSRSGIYAVSANAAVDVSGSNSPAPMSVWLHKGGSTLFYGLNQALPAEPTPSGTNSEYITMNTTISLVAGDLFSISLLSPSPQTILGGATTYMSVSRISLL